MIISVISSMIVSCVHPKVLDEVGTDIEELLIKATGGNILKESLMKYAIISDTAK